MKPAAEWDLNYILQLPQGEFDWVEFKNRRMLDSTAPGADEGKIADELGRQVSAFSNSGGGVLVYGITNPTDNKPKSVDDGGISINCKRPNIREWLEDVIPNHVEFPLKKFNVYALTNKHGAPGLADDRCIVLVDIPDSDDAPHQSVREQRYFARVGGKTKPIGHRLVTDIIHRGRNPIFDVKFALQSKTYMPRAFIPAFQAQAKPHRSVTFTVGAMNRGKVYAKHLHLAIWMPAEFVSTDPEAESMCELNGVRYRVWECNNRRRDVNGTMPEFGTKIYGASWVDPILPGLERIWEFACNSRFRREQLGDQKLLWDLHCDNSPKVTGEIKLRNIPFEVLDGHPASSIEYGPV